MEFTTSDGDKVIAHSSLFKLRCPKALEGTTFAPLVQISLPDVNKATLEIVLEVLYNGDYRPSPFLSLAQIFSLYQVVDLWSYHPLRPWIDDQLKIWLGRASMSESDFGQLFPMGLKGMDYVLSRCFKYIRTTRNTPLLLEQINAENFEQVRKVCG